MTNLDLFFCKMSVSVWIFCTYFHILGGQDWPFFRGMVSLWDLRFYWYILRDLRFQWEYWPIWWPTIKNQIIWNIYDIPNWLFLTFVANPHHQTHHYLYHDNIINQVCPKEPVANASENIWNTNLKEKSLKKINLFFRLSKQGVQNGEATMFQRKLV